MEAVTDYLFFLLIFFKNFLLCFIPFLALWLIYKFIGVIKKCPKKLQQFVTRRKQERALKRAEKKQKRIEKEAQKNKQTPFTGYSSQPPDKSSSISDLWHKV